VRTQFATFIQLNKLEFIETQKSGGPKVVIGPVANQLLTRAILETWAVRMLKSAQIIHSDIQGGNHFITLLNIQYEQLLHAKDNLLKEVSERQVHDVTDLPGGPYWGTLEYYIETSSFIPGLEIVRDISLAYKVDTETWLQEKSSLVVKYIKDSNITKVGQVRELLGNIVIDWADLMTLAYQRSFSASANRPIDMMSKNVGESISGRNVGFVVQAFKKVYTLADWEIILHMMLNRTLLENEVEDEFKLED